MRVNADAQRRPGPRPRRHSNDPDALTLSAIAQRRPGPRPRRHVLEGPHHELDEVRSTKAGAETPATPRPPMRTLPTRATAQRRPGPRPRRHWRDESAAAVAGAAQRRPGPRPRRHRLRELPCSGRGSPRSTKAGAETPATRCPRPDVVLEVNRRSTKAGAETPATPPARGAPNRRRSSLNEGRGRDPGDTGRMTPELTIQTRRSTKAGAETPATPLVRRRRS